MAVMDAQRMENARYLEYTKIFPNDAPSDSGRLTD